MTDGTGTTSYSYNPVPANAARPLGHTAAMRLCLFFFITVVFMGPFAQGFPAYYDITEHDQAQAEARKRNLPLDWLGGVSEGLNIGPPGPSIQADLEQMAMAALRDNVVIIFFDGRNMAPVPP